MKDIKPKLLRKLEKLNLSSIISSARSEVRSPRCEAGKGLHLSFSSGFTIVELLVVLTMVGLVSGIGIFSLVNYGNSQTMEQGVGSIKGIFDEAKFNALSSVELKTDDQGVPVACVGGLSEYRVDIVFSQEQDMLKLYMECVGSYDLVKTYTLSENLNLSVDTLDDDLPCNEVSYKAISLSATGLPSLPCVVIVKGFNITKTITIDTIGNLTITTTNE